MSRSSIRTHRRFSDYSEAEITGKSLVETIIPLRAGRNAGGFVPDMALNTDGTSLRINEMVLRDGEQVWVAWTNTSIRDPDGHISEYVCIGHDITDHTHRDRRRISTALWRDKVISGTDVKEEVFEAVLNLGLEISKEGREGHQIGTAFVIGDIENVLKESRQLVIEPIPGSKNSSSPTTRSRRWSRSSPFSTGRSWSGATGGSMLRGARSPPIRAK